MPFIPLAMMHQNARPDPNPAPIGAKVAPLIGRTDVVYPGEENRLRVLALLTGQKIPYKHMQKAGSGIAPFVDETIRIWSSGQN